MKQNDRIPPQSPEIERIVLGGMLCSLSAAEEALSALEVDCFYSAQNRIVFEEIKTCVEKNIPFDVEVIAQRLVDSGKIEAVGGKPYLAELLESVCTASMIPVHSSTLVEKSIGRKLISAAGEIESSCFSTESTPSEVLKVAESKIFEISQKKETSKADSIGSLLPGFFKEVESYVSKKEGLIKTGFTELDSLLGSLDGGDLIIIAGRPSMGKTAFCLSLATNSSIKYKNSAAIFSLEMSKSQLVQRIMCSEARVNMHSLRCGTLPKRDLPKLSFSAGVVSEAGIFIDDTPSITPIELKSKSRRLIRTENVKMIIIDYLQLMSAGVKFDSRQQEISYISRSLKGIAKELNVPVIALSQLSRAPENRTGEKRPQLSDLRESGAIEQDADIVLFVYRDEVYNKDSNEKGVAEIMVSKQRNGPLGTAKIAFVKEFARFENLAAETAVDDGWRD